MIAKSDIEINIGILNQYCKLEAWANLVGGSPVEDIL